MNTRPHCSCEQVRNYSVEQAAEKLGCRERLLRDHLKQVPHQKFGDQRVFCECELRLVMAMFTVTPGSAAVEPKAKSETPAVRQLRQIRPAGRRRSHAG
ncbi:hypothetical protein ACFYOF_20285 [Streptomyces sp. NPDC007148]|uniref:hypothetical protein n=1 Tax=Streptomyces sp. NPDC007148 TaxID=3364775 RepID=UPI003682C76B